MKINDILDQELKNSEFAKEFYRKQQQGDIEPLA